jgi:hypothetical protein
MGASGADVSEGGLDCHALAELFGRSAARIIPEG